MAAIIKASSAIIKAKKFIPQRKSNTAAKVQSKSVSLVPKVVQNNNNPSGKLVKSPSEGLVKYNQEEDVTKINPTPIRKKDDPILNLLKQIESKVIKVDKLLKTSLLGKRKLNEKGRVTKEREKFKKREGELEKGEKSIPGLPKMGGGIIGGFLEGVKRFFFFTMLGWVFFRILPLLPKLKSIAGFIGKAIDFGFTLFSGLVSGLTTFLAEGIKLTNSITKSIGWLSGARTEEDFNKFEKTFNRIVDLTILAAMLTADAGLDLFKKPRGNVQPRPRPGVSGRPGVTTSGGRSAGRFGNVREGLRNANPLRQQPSVTTSGGRNINSGSRISEGLRRANPLRRGPTVTSSGRAVSRGFNLPKINPKGAISGIRTLGVGLLLDYGVQVASNKLDKSVLEKQTADFKKKSPKEQAEIIKRIEYRLNKEKQWQSGAGGVFDKIISLGGSSSSERVSEGLQQRLDSYNQVKSGSYYKGGIVGRSGINGYVKGGSIVQPTVKSTNIHILSKKPEHIKSKKTIPGKDVGGENQIKKIFLDTSPEEISITKTISSALNPLASIFNFFGGGSGASQETVSRTKSKNTRGLPNPFQLLLKTSKIFKEDPRSQGTSLDFINKISASAVDTLLGNKPDKGIYRSIASSILFLANSIANKQIYGVKSSISSILGFASGGNVPSTSATNSKNIVESQESTLRSLTDSIGFSMEQSSNRVLDSVRGEARKAAAIRQRRQGPVEPGAGRQDMLEENIRRARDGAQPSESGARPSGGGGDKASTGNENERALLDMLAQAEGTSKSYGTVFGGNVNKDLAEGKLTVKEVIQLAKSARTGSGATGRYQFMPSTLENLIRKGVLNPNDKFTPQAQDKAALALVRGRGVDPSKPLTKRDVYRLGGEWAALEGGPDMKPGGSYSYNGRSQVKYTADQALKIYSDKLKAVQEEERSRSNDKIPAGKARIDKKNSILNTLATTDKLDVQPSGYCVTAVLETLQKNGIPNPAATGLDRGNNPRGMMSQLINQHGWASLPGAGNRITLNSPYGKANANQMTYKQYKELVDAGKIPSGALVFQTRHSTWNGESAGSRGYDAAIARNGGKNLWNGYMNGDSIYANTQSVIVLVPKRSIVAEPPKDKPKPNDKPKSLAQNLTPTTREKLEEKGVIEKGGKFYKKGGGLFGMDMELEVSDKKNSWISNVVMSGQPAAAKIQPTPQLTQTPTPTGVTKDQQTALSDFKDTRRVLGINIGAGHQGPGGGGTSDKYGTGVPEHRATLHMLNAIKSLIDKDPEMKKVTTFTSFTDNNFAKDNAKLFTNLQKQMVEIHFDQRRDSENNYTGGRSGIIPARSDSNRDYLNKALATTSSIDIALAKRFGNYGRNFMLGEKGISDTGGTLLELGAIDDNPALMQEIKRGIIGPETLKLAQYTYEGIREGAVNEGLVKPLLKPGQTLPKAKPTGATRPGATPPTRPGTKPGTKPAAKPKREWWDPRGWVGKQEGGSIEARMNKSQPNIPIPNKFASYESPQSKNFIALQQIIVEKPSMDRSKRVAPSLSSSNALNSSRMNRMQSTSRS